MENGLVVVGTEFKPWQIKDFSVALRQEIVRQAEDQRVTLAEWLHAYFAKHGFDGVEVVLPRQALPSPTLGDEFLQLAQLARTLTPPDRDSAAMRLARSIVRDRLKALQSRDAPAEPPVEPALPQLEGRKRQAEIARS